MDYSFQIDMGDRKKSHVMPNPNVYLKRYTNSYAERYKKGRQRQRPFKEKSSRRLHGSEEDLVKTGSEDGDELDIEKQIELARKARPKRAERRKEIMKEELINTKQRNNYAMNNKENKEEFYRPRNRTAEEPKHVYKNSLSPVSNKSFPLRGVPMQPYVYPPSAKNGEIHFSPKFFNMYQVQENTHENELQETTFIKNEEVEEVRNGAKSNEQMREEARSKRISILNRAEKLVENISRSDQYSSDDEIKIDKPKPRRKKHSKKNEKSRTEAKFIQTKDISSSSDEDKYVLVKTTVSPEPPENVNLELPRFIQPSEYQSNISLHSNEKDVNFQGDSRKVNPYSIGSQRNNRNVDQYRGKMINNNIHSKIKTDNKNAVTTDVETIITDNEVRQSNSKDKECETKSATASQMKNAKDSSKRKEGRKKPVKFVDKYQPNEYQVLHCGEYLVRVLKGGGDKRRSAERRIGVRKLLRSKGQILDEKEAVHSIEKGHEDEVQDKINQLNINSSKRDSNGDEKEVDGSKKIK
ncbi:unnamed protein product [Mytilus coruscus]|uniref:Uncharacterized protein n=1 Tax=Mytilus coruscus TaxID=42192 RepID=A0A6J8AIL1_MYTCO|nr:unnamed protein product [Mytilus coruscus]